MSKIVTSCKDCKFAIFNKNTQTGCEFGLIDKYKQADIGVIEAYDEDQEFYVIDRICVFSRHKSKDISKEDVLIQSQVRYQIIIYLDDDINKFENTLNSVVKQHIKPQHITAIQPFDVSMPPFAFTKLLARTGIKWRYQSTQNPEMSKLDCVDMCIDVVAYPYYVVINSGFIFDDNFSSCFNNLVNEKITQFTFINGDHIIVVPTVYHKQLGGNAFSSLLTKIEQEKELKDKIYNIEDIFNV